MKQFDWLYGLVREGGDHNVWIKGRGNTAVKLKQGRRGRGGGRAGDYVGGGRAKFIRFYF